MKPIDFRKNFAEVLLLSEEKPHSFRYKSMLNQLYDSFSRSSNGNRDNQSIKLRNILTGIFVALLAVLALVEQTVRLSDAMKNAFMVAGVLYMVAVIALSSRTGLSVQREINHTLKIIFPRIRALSETEIDSVLDTLNTEPSYLRKLPTDSEAPCGCIRCQALFPARNIPWSDMRRHEGQCPQCGAAMKYLVFSDNYTEINLKGLTLLHNLFDEEN